MNFAGGDLLLTLDGLRQTADRLRCDAAAVLAVIDVETSGCGFLPDRRLQLLFERHRFRRETGGRFDKIAPDLSAPSAGGYGGGGAGQYDRLARAMALDKPAALRSASWGLGQIMGGNAEHAGYDDAAAMVAAFAADENEQLLAIARFILAERLDGALRAHRWAEFAHGYNGPQYWKHDYDERLAAAHARHVRGPAINFDVRAAQVRMMFAGLYRARIDGVMGPLTRAALDAATRNGINYMVV